MPKLLSFTAALSAFLTVATMSKASAGFNCADQSSLANDAKRLVCTDHRLSTLNSREDTQFVSLRTRLIPEAQLTIVRDRVNFVRTRNTCGADKRCLEATYNAQLRLYARLNTCFTKRIDQSTCTSTTTEKHRQSLHKSL
ncbi:MAG: hypothetical protein HOO99_00855 [Hyphomicrobiaceae bacterium]|nr:hypothetical protein [Hyphomicrobiaceae bacterium]